MLSLQMHFIPASYGFIAIWRHRDRRTWIIQIARYRLEEFK